MLQAHQDFEDRSAVLTVPPQPLQFICAGCKTIENTLERKLPPGWTTDDETGAVRCIDCTASARIYGRGVAAIAADPAEFIRTWPREMDQVLADILGMSMREVITAACAYRAAGFAIPEAVESEQAFILHRYIALWVQHGDAWRAAAHADLEQARADAAAGATKRGTVSPRRTPPLQ